MKSLLSILVKKDQPATFSVIRKIESKRDKETERDKRWRESQGSGEKWICLKKERNGKGEKKESAKGKDEETKKKS